MATTPQNTRYYTYVKPVLENKIVKSYASYIFSLVTIGILIFFAIRPTVTTILKLQTSIDENQKLLDQLNQKAENLSQAQRNYDKMDASLKTKITTALPASAEITTLTKYLDTLVVGQASDSALQIQPVPLYDARHDYNAPIPKPTLAEVNFTYNIVGDYQQILLAIDKLTRLPRIITIKKLTVSRQVDSPTILSITAKAQYMR